MLWAGAIGLAPLRQESLLPEAPTTRLSTSKAKPMPPMSLTQINEYYKIGHPSNNLSGHRPAGLVVHMKDATESYGTGHMYQPGDNQFQKFWATSIVNRNMPGLYTDECGVIVNPRAVKVLCSGPNDISSWNFGCKQRDLYPPDKLEAMLNISWNRERWRANNGSVGEFNGKYNEVVIDSAVYRSMLPRSVAAVFYTSGTDPGCAIRTYQTIVNMYDLDPGEVLLLKHHPGRTPGFVKDAFMDKMPPKPEEACPKPTDWCAYPGAVNEPKECGGPWQKRVGAKHPVPGHFCHDKYGKTGFSPCDSSKYKPAWGSVQCDADPEEKQGKAADDPKEGCPKPAQWCRHAGAVNEPKKCGGVLGHFCHDRAGKSGFSPCDLSKYHAVWGHFQCDLEAAKELLGEASASEEGEASATQAAAADSDGGDLEEPCPGHPNIHRRSDTCAEKMAHDAEDGPRQELEKRHLAPGACVGARPQDWRERLDAARSQPDEGEVSCVASCADPNCPQTGCECDDAERQPTPQPREPFWWAAEGEGKQR